MLKEVLDKGEDAGVLTAEVVEGVFWLRVLRRQTPLSGRPVFARMIVRAPSLSFSIVRNEIFFVPVLSRVLKVGGKQSSEQGKSVFVKAVRRDDEQDVRGGVEVAESQFHGSVGGHSGCWVETAVWMVPAVVERVQRTESGEVVSSDATRIRQAFFERHVTFFQSRGIVESTGETLLWMSRETDDGDSGDLGVKHVPGVCPLPPLVRRDCGFDSKSKLSRFFKTRISSRKGQSRNGSYRHRPFRQILQTKSSGSSRHATQTVHDGRRSCLWHSKYQQTRRIAPSAIANRVQRIIEMRMLTMPKIRRDWNYSQERSPHHHEAGGEKGKQKKKTASTISRLLFLFRNDASAFPLERDLSSLSHTRKGAG